MKRKTRKRTGTGAGKASALAALQPAEAAEVLRAIVARHPELAPEAEELARATVTDVDVEDIAADVEGAVLAVDMDEMAARAGRKSWGYVEPTDAAWALLEEAVQPYLDQMKRRMELGFEAAAVATCQGIVLGLYRCRGRKTHDVRRQRAAGGLLREVRSPVEPAAFLEQIPEWADLIEPAARRSPAPAPGRRRRP